MRSLRHLVRLSAAAVFSSTLLACGGGGGGAPTPPVNPAPVEPAPPPSTLPLLVTSSNVGSVASFGFNYAALALGVGQLAVDWTERIDSSPALSFTHACAEGGSATGTLDDRDGDRHASAGDRVTVTLAGCFLKELNATFDGKVIVTLAAPLASQQRAGVLTFVGFGVHTGTPSMDLAGAFRFAYSASRLSKLIRVYSDTQPLNVTHSDSTRAVSDEVTALDATHETRLDTARATTTVRFHLDSQMLGGSVEVATATPWSAWFDSWPDAGELTMTGASGSKAGLRAAPAKANGVDVLLADTVVGEGTLQGGYLWSSAPWLPAIAAAPRYTTQTASETGFRALIQPDPAPLLPNGSLVWVYSRPLDPVTLAGVQFMQTSLKGNGMFTHVPAKVTLEGGMLTLTPATQLQLGTGYALNFPNYRGMLRDTSGAEITAPVYSGEVAQTVSASLVASAAPVLLGSGASLTLDAGASSAIGGPPASFRWRQLSGPPLALGDTSAPRLTLAEAGMGNGIALVELEVANATGDVDRKQLSVTVAPDISNALVVGYRSGNGSMAVIGNIDPTLSTAYAKYYSNNSALDILVATPQGGSKRFFVGLSGGQTWRIGVPYNYVRGDPNVGGTGWSPCFDNNTTSFTILEFALDGAGQLARLALDFDDVCSGTTTQGSIRYRSALPLRQ